MRGLLMLAVVAGLLYAGYTYGLPLLEQRKQAEARAATEAAERSEATRCVEAATNANNVFAREVRSLTKPPDPTIWGTTLISVGGQITAADNACSCAASACRKAAAAAYQLRQFLDSYHRAMRHSDPTGLLDAAEKQSAIDALLDQARSEI